MTLFPRLGMLVFALIASALLVTAGVPFSFADPSPDSDLVQGVAAREEWSNEASEVAIGHVDLGPRLIDGQWRADLRHGVGSGPVWHDPSQTILRASDAAVMATSDSADYLFPASVAGRPVYVVSQTQNSSAVWLGWNTRDPAVAATTDRDFTMHVGPMNGPGRVQLLLQSGAFGKSFPLADSGMAPGDVWIDSGTHVHANWAFSAPGIYMAVVTFLSTTIADEAVAASTTLHFATGDAASASEALTMAALAAADSASAGASASSPSTVPAASGAADPAGSFSIADVQSGGLPDWTLLAIIVVAAAPLLVISAPVITHSRHSRTEQAAIIAEVDSILTPLPAARDEGLGEDGPDFVDRGGEQ